MAAPRLTGNPVICLEGKMLRLSYDFTEAENDCSDIIWYRSRNIRVEDKIVTAISQPDQPEKVYALTGDDVGYYIFAQIRPRTNRSEYGEAVQCFYEKAISPEDVETDRIWTDFITFLFTAMPETKKVYGILMRSVRRIPVILKSGTGKRRRSPGDYGCNRGRQ